MPEKKLTPEQVDQLNANAAQMLEQGYSVDEIKSMASQYFNEFASEEGEPVNFTPASLEQSEGQSEGQKTGGETQQFNVPSPEEVIANQRKSKYTQGQYSINGTSTTKEDLDAKMKDPAFMSKVKSGEIDIKAQEYESSTGDIVSTSDGEFTVDVSGTININGKQYSYDEVTTLLNGDTDRAIKMFVNHSPIDAVIKSPTKEKTIERYNKLKTEQERIAAQSPEDRKTEKLELDTKYGLGEYYDNYNTLSEELSMLNYQVKELEEKETPSINVIDSLKNETYIKSQELQEVVGNITAPIIRDNLNKYISEDGEVNPEYTTTDYYGFTVVDREKVLENLDPDKERIANKNIEKNYLNNIENAIQNSIDIPAKKVTEETDRLYKEEYGESFDDALGDVSQKEFNKRYGNLVENIESEYVSKADSTNNSISNDIEQYQQRLNESLIQETEKIKTEYNNLLQQPAVTQADADLINSKIESLEKERIKIADSYIQQETDYIADANARANKINNEFLDKANESLNTLNQEFSNEFEIPKELLDNYNSKRKSAAANVLAETNAYKKSVIQQDNKTEDGQLPTKQKEQYGRIITSTLSSLGGSMYGLTTAMGYDLPELKRMEQYFTPGVDPIAGFKDLNTYNIQEATGNLVGSMIPSLAASMGTAAVTRNLSASARMFLVAFAGFSTETADLSGRAYREALSRTGSKVIADKAVDETVDSQLILAPSYLLGSKLYTGGWKKIFGKELNLGGRVLVGAGAEFTEEGVLQEYPQQLFEEAIKERGEYEAAPEFASVEKFEGVMANVSPVMLLGGAGALSMNAIGKFETAINNYPELSRQELIDFVYKNGKEKAAFRLSALRANGVLDKSTTESMYEYVESIDLNNSQEYTAIKARRDNLIQQKENETDDIKQKVINKQISELETELENIIEGKETKIEKVTIGGVDFFIDPIASRTTSVVQDLNNVQEEIDKSAKEETVEETPLVTDESGEVVTVYRGGKPASGVQYYTSDQKLAEGIGEGKGEGVQKATVRMANPWTPETLDVNNAPQWMQDWVRSREEFTTVDEETMAAEEIPMEQAIQEIKDMQLSFRDVDLWQSFVNEALEHHDGIIAFDPSEDMATDKKIYITKSPEQVVTEEAPIVTEETKIEEITPSPFVKTDEGLSDYNGMFSKTQSQGSTATDPLQDDVGGKRGYFFFQKSEQAEVKMMTPDEYLSKVRSNFGNNSEKQNVTEEKKQRINKAVEEGNKIDMPYLDFRRKGFRQEGRNRAVVAKERGEEKIPVLILRDVTDQEKVYATSYAVREAIEATDFGTKEQTDSYLGKVYHRDALRNIKESPSYKINVEPLVTEEAPTSKLTEETTEDTTEGKKEITEVKSGTHTSSNPIKIFKGLGGKVDLKGVRINAHEGVKGVFTAVDEDLAKEYAKDKGMSETTLPAGTTFEVVEVDGTGMTPGQYRAAEVKAINDSKADVVKLITVDGKIKAGTKKQEQYVIKNEKLIEDAIQEQAAGKVPVQQKAKAGEKVEEGKPKAEPEKPTQKGKEEVSEEVVSVQQAKDNLSTAWETWKEQQKTLGVVFDPQSKADEDIALARAIIDYLKAVGANTIKDIKIAVKDFTNNEVKLNNDGLDYLLKVSRKENIDEKVKKGVTDGVSYVDLEKSLKKEGYPANEIKKRYNAFLDSRKPIAQQLDNYEKEFEESRNKQREKAKLPERIVNSIGKILKATVDPKIDSKKIFRRLGTQSVLDRMQNLYGTSGTIKFRFTEAYDKIYKGLSSKDTTTLDKIIQLRRFIAIDKNRIKKGLPKIENPGYITGEQAQKLLNKLQERIGQSKFLDLNKRADTYFNEFRGILDRLQDASIITKELRDELYEIDYQPRKFLNFILEADSRKKTKNEEAWQTGVRQEIIKKLETGSAEELFNNSEWLLSTALSQAETAIVYNKFNINLAKALSDLKSKYDTAKSKGISVRTKADRKLIAEYKRSKDSMILNPNIGVDKNGNPKYKFDTVPDGFSVVNYKVDGVPNQIFIKDEIYNEVYNINKTEFISPKWADRFSTVSGAKLLRTMATGANPAFVLGNLPNDIGFALTFEPAYSSVLPKAMAQLSKDFKNAVVSMQKKDQTYRDFVEYGGMMDFLYTEGALDAKNTTNSYIDKAFGLFTDEKLFKEKKEAIGNGLTYLNQMSEVGIRLGVYKRVFDQEMRKINSQTFESEKNKQEAIENAKHHAVARARNLIDFSQGGTVVKELNKQLPYLNAAFQALYSASQLYYKNPVRSTLIMAQAAGAFTSGTMLISYGLIAALKSDDEDEEEIGKIYYKTLDGISDHTKRKYFVIPTGVKNSKGNYEYIKIKKTQNLTPIFTLTEHYVNNSIREQLGLEKESEEKLKNNIYDAISDDIDPTGLFNPNIYTGGEPVKKGISQLVNRNPGASALMVLTTGYDPYRNKFIDKFDDYPELAGYDDPNIQDFYKDLSFISSPARLKVATEKIITNPNTNPFVGAVYAFADVTTKDKEVTSLITEPAKGFMKGMTGRMMGETSPYIKDFQQNEKLREKLIDIESERMDINMERDDIIQKYISKEINKKQLNEKAKKLSEKLDIEDRKSLFEGINKRIANPNIPSFYFSVAYSDEFKNDPEKQASKIVYKFGEDILDNPTNYKEMQKTFNKIGFKIGKELRLEIVRLVNPEGADEYIDRKINPRKDKNYRGSRKISPAI